MGCCFVATSNDEIEDPAITSMDLENKLAEKYKVKFVKEGEDKRMINAKCHTWVKHCHEVAIQFLKFRIVERPEILAATAFYSHAHLNYARSCFLAEHRDKFDEKVGRYTGVVACESPVGWGESTKGQEYDITYVFAYYEFHQGEWHEITCYPSFNEEVRRGVRDTWTDTRK